MSVTLGILAGIIFLLYSLYFIKIIKGDPRSFEIELLRSLADWIISKGAASKPIIWLVLLASILAEILYFALTLIVIDNPVMKILTELLIIAEIYHIMRISISLNLFFSGRYLLGQVFNWRVERASAAAFFTHSFLIIIIIMFY